MPGRENQGSVHSSKGSAKLKDTWKALAVWCSCVQGGKRLYERGMQGVCTEEDEKGWASFPSCSTPTHIGQVYLPQRVAKHYLMKSLGGHSHFPFLCPHATQPVMVPEDPAG